MYSIDIDGCPDAELDYVIDLLISERDRGRGRRRGSTRRSSPGLGSATSATPTAGRTSAGTGKEEAAFEGRVVEGAKATHNGSPGHNLMIK